MCDLCSQDPNEKRRAIESQKRIADKLIELAGCYNGLAAGRIDPHGDTIKNYSMMARSIIRSLVEDWV